ncbi:cysteine-rich CWC family protein [Teredinibacter haidensis]|uniref:cysteine-rich CWC family protein n=1 Tax=Teredinibacter haidensis TaxID=2731755 RepID=UPI000948F0D5|nr:cysteine-rich CWC family protein [Teredinibacter haidensis]
MSRTEKPCPRCEKPFQCNAADISNCQCFKVQISPKAQAFIAKRWQECLCNQCLKRVQFQLISADY